MAVKETEIDRLHEEALRENAAIRQEEIRARAAERARVQERRSSKDDPPETETPFFSAKASFSWLLLLCIINDFYDWYSGYQINPISLGIDAFTFIVFYLNGFKSGTKFFLLLTTALLDFILPGPLAGWGIAPQLTGIIIIIPWWVVFALISKYSFGIESKFADSIAIVGFIVGVFLLTPFLLTSPTDTVINQKWVHTTWDVVSNAFSNAGSSVSLGWKQIQCSYFSISEEAKSACVQDLTKANQEDQLKNLKVQEIPGSGFSAEFTEIGVQTGDTLLDNKIPVRISAVNNLQTPITLEFACGLEGRAGGTVVPTTKIVAKGRLPLQESSVSCENLDISKRGTPTFYFNMTAKDVSSSGDKEIFIVSDAAKTAVLSQYEGISENKVLLLSREFGEFLRATQSRLSPRVAADDLVQPIIRVGVTTSIEAEQILVYGIKPGLKTQFALFLKNNGKGSIANIKKITFKLPDDFAFDVSDCGITDAKLQSTDWRRITVGNLQRVALCTIEVRGEKQYPNQIDSRLFTATVEYDYVLSKGIDVNIAPGIVTT